MANPEQDDFDVETGQPPESEEISYLLFSSPDREEVVIAETEDNGFSASSSNIVDGYPDEEFREPRDPDGIDSPRPSVNRESPPPPIEDNQQVVSNGTTGGSENPTEPTNPDDQVAHGMPVPTSQRAPRQLTARMRHAIHQFVETFLARFGLRGLIRLLIALSSIYGNHSDPLLERLFQYSRMQRRHNAQPDVTPRHYQPGYFRLRATSVEITEADSTTEEISGRANPGDGEDETLGQNDPIQCSLIEPEHDEQGRENVDGQQTIGVSLQGNPSSENNDWEEFKGKYTKNHSQNLGLKTENLNENESFHTCLTKEETPKGDSRDTSQIHSSGQPIPYSTPLPNTHSNEPSVSNPNENSNLGHLTTNDSNKLFSSQNNSSVVSSYKGKERELLPNGVNNGEEPNLNIQILDSNSHQREELEGVASQETSHEQSQNMENQRGSWAAQFPFLEAAVSGRQMPNAALPRESPQQQRHVVRQEADTTGLPMDVEESQANVREVIRDNIVISINHNLQRSSGRRRLGGRRHAISSDERRMLRIRYLTSLLRYSRSGTNRRTHNNSTAQFARLHSLVRNSIQSVPIASGSNSNQNNFRWNIRNIRVRSNEVPGRILNEVPRRAMLVGNTGPTRRRHIPRSLSNRPPGSRPMWARAAWIRPSWALASLPRIAYMRPSWARPVWTRPSWARPVWVRPSWALSAPGSAIRVRNIPLRATSFGAPATRSAILHPSWARLDWLRYRWSRPAANYQNSAQVRGTPARPAVNNFNAARNNALRLRNLARQEQGRAMGNRESRGRQWTERLRAMRHRRFRASRQPSGSRHNNNNNNNNN